MNRLPDGSGFFVADVDTSRLERIKRKLSGFYGRKCTSCGRRGAISYNPYNKVVQCHHCGHNYGVE